MFCREDKKVNNKIQIDIERVNNKMTMVMERVSNKANSFVNFKVHTDAKKGDIYMADLSGAIGSEQTGVRPVLISQNNRGNFHSPTTQIIPLTTSSAKAKLPTHVQLYAQETNLSYDSVALVEQQRVIDKNRLLYKVCEVDSEVMKQVGKAMIISYDLGDLFYH